MITIATTVFDIRGSVRFREKRGDSDVETLLRRGNKTATLDGGSYNEDLGFTDSDRDLKIKLLNPTISVVDGLKYLLRNYATVTIAMADGMFLGSLSAVNIGSDVTLTFRITSRISQEP